ncbi:MAG: hypothetical protein ACK5Y2_05925 [Bdellovibrionales bacterium]
MPLLAFGKNLSWSTKWVREYNNKSWSDICRKPSLRADFVCTNLKPGVRSDKTKMRWRLESSDTLEISYKKEKIRLRRADEPLVFLVNRRSLYLQETKSIKSMVKAIQKLMTTTQTSQSLFLDFAYADDVPTLELSHATALIVLQTKEHEICETAQKIVKSCQAFNEKFMTKVEKARKSNVEDVPKVINGAAQLKAASNLQTQGEKFLTLFSPLEETRTTALTRCECTSGLCQIKKKKTEIGAEFLSCKTQMKALRDLKKARDLKPVKNSLLSEEIDSAAQLISHLEKKKLEINPPAFREDSYRGK